jgi:hypothetical protein
LNGKLGNSDKDGQISLIGNINKRDTANVHTMIYVHLGHLASGAMIHTEYDFWNGVASVV